jgi:sigma-B regulation protein RsbU (phosphoserine phosphatase)
LAYWTNITKRLDSLGLVPRTRLARFTGYLAAVESILLLLRWIFTQAGKTAIADPLRGWTVALGMLLAFLLLFLSMRWFRNHVMWSVRNRLIVTYLFIGALPIVLVLVMASVSAWLFGMQFSAFVTVSEIQAQLLSLQAENAATAELVAERGSAAAAGRAMEAEDTVFPGRVISVLPEAARPAWIKDGFHSLVLDQGRIYLRAANVVNVGHKPFTVISSVPLDQKLLGKIAADLGPIALYIPQKDATDREDFQILPDGRVLINGEPAVGISAGSLPPPRNRWDRELSYYARIQPTKWETGESTQVAIIEMMGSIRYSAVYSRLSSSMSQWVETWAIGLAALAIVFGIIMLIALLIGFRLTRTVTYSVANLYKATEHINSGDLTHRIKVRAKDQLAALQTSFNSMTESLQRLIAEQKEKERLQSELEIAQEVQAQLFPSSTSSVRTLDLHGICRPARIVSGDYYDFLFDGSEQVGIALGDISGKGISAALLMATIHSAIRAYGQEQLVAVGAMSEYSSSTRAAAVAPRLTRPSPAQMLWLLNRHIYSSTQPEKYATLFLGFYDDETRRLTYSNAGHLPPIILGEDGSMRRLDTGGTVVGLFDNVEYEEQTVELYPGDILVAFSDGMTEPENEFGEFGEERLIATISAYRHLPLDRICEHAVAAVEDWIGSTEQPDDVTLVLARRIELLPAEPAILR